MNLTLFFISNKNPPLMKKSLQKLIISFIVLFAFAFNTTAQTVTPFTTSSTWTCPAGVTSVKVECWGAGGSGGGFSSSISLSGGGGGGAYTVNNTVAVVPGTTYTITVGVGPAGTNLSGIAANIIHIWSRGIVSLKSRASKRFSFLMARCCNFLICSSPFAPLRSQRFCTVFICASFSSVVDSR